jgi:glucose/arabinose dehydrogenase
MREQTIAETLPPPEVQNGPATLVRLLKRVVAGTVRNQHPRTEQLAAKLRGQKTTVGTVPDVTSTDGEGGLLGLAVSPCFDTDHWVYLFHTTATDNRIVRIKYDNGSLDLASEQMLLSGIARNKFHDGGRLRFGPDGKLYASTGDAQNGANAQNLNSLNGKILRLNPDGSVPADNPFPGRYVWSYGHRNVEGLAFDSHGRLWEAELGNSIMDELNLIRKGGNYGWPACEGTAGSCDDPTFIAPVQTWPVAAASPSGLAIVDNTLYMAALRGTQLFRMTITGRTTTAPQAYFTGTYGRLRTVERAPDGGLWLTTSNGGDKDSTPNNSNNVILHVALGGGRR